MKYDDIEQPDISCFNMYFLPFERLYFSKGSGVLLVPCLDSYAIFSKMLSYEDTNNAVAIYILYTNKYDDDVHRIKIKHAKY